MSDVRRDHRHLVLFSDGTGNSSAKLFRTNVWKLYRALDLADHQDPTRPRQFAFYDDGVGSSGFRPLALIGGIFGYGLARNVRDLYAFVCRSYREGDKIYAFGFSRGAFTIRIVVALMLNQGLVRYDGNEAHLARDVAAAYRSYRRRFWKDYPPAKVIRDVRDGIIALWHGKRYRQEDNAGLESSTSPLEIEFVGVWDTVAAYGTPVEELTHTIDKWFWPLSMPNHDLSPRVKRAMHALSLDDERHTFHPMLWSEGVPIAADTGKGAPPAGSPEPPNGWNSHGTIKAERLSQVWFAGVHSDVGGGYPDDALSHVSLGWIIEGAQAAALRFLPETLAEYYRLADENGPINDSRKGIGGYYRYSPRRIEKLIDTRKVKIDRIKVHESVLRRIRVGDDGYAPIVIPPEFDVVRYDGSIVPAQQWLPDVKGEVVDHYDPKAFGAARELVFNQVWRRRVVYFMTLFATLLLATSPLILDDGRYPAEGCTGALCPLMAPLASLQAFLPAFASIWFDPLRSHPEFTIPALAVIAFGLSAGKRLHGRVQDEMRRIWRSIPATYPRETRGRSFPEEPRPSVAEAWLQRIRLSSPYEKTFEIIKRTLLPAVFMLALIYLGLAVGTRAVFAFRDAAGTFCRSVPEREFSAGPAEIPISSRCGATGFRLERGGTYRITLTIPPGSLWSDWGNPADLNGITGGWRVGVAEALGLPMRRHLDERWFQPMARIGETGRDSYALTPDISRSATGARLVQTTTIVARVSGKLFVYVNDAVAHRWFYDNNSGLVLVGLELLPER